MINGIIRHRVRPGRKRQSLRVVLVRYVKLLGQIALLCGISLLGGAVALWIPLKVPGFIWGMGILYVLLESGLLPLDWVADGAELLIAHLVLFFIPSAVGIVNFSEVMRQQSFALLTTIGAGTAIILVFVYFFSEWSCGFRRQRR